MQYLQQNSYLNYNPLEKKSIVLFILGRLEVSLLD